MNDSPSLEELQQWMHQNLIHPERSDARETERRVESSAKLTAPEAFAIYQRSYYLRLLKCMEEQFPALGHALGSQLFTDFARLYLRANPPQSHSLYDLGRRLPAYLEDTRPDGTAPEAEREPWIDFMVDLSRFEYSIFLMFDAPGHEGHPFATADTPDAELILQPCLRLETYRFPVAWYYHEVRRKANPELPPREPGYVALVRKDYITHTHSLGAAEFKFLSALRDGRSVGDALARGVNGARPGENPLMDLWLVPRGPRERWISAGFFVDRRERSRP